jgi:hypothetical protein
LLVDGWGGGYFVNYRDDLHAYGSLEPIAPYVACMVIRPDGSRVLARGWNACRNYRADPAAEPNLAFK